MNMLQKAMRMDIIYGLKSAQLIFSVSELFSINLQAKDTSILQEATEGGDLFVAHYQSLHTESRSNTPYDDIL